MSKSLNFKIKNNSGIDNTKVFIGFWGQTLNAEINGSAMIPNKWYTLSKITSFVFDVTTSGRIYVAYNETFTPTGNTIPSVLTPSSDGYNKRFDKFELTFDGTEYGVADLTAIDFWSIPMSLETSLNGVTNAKKLEGIKKGSSYEDISNVLTNLSNPIQSSGTATAVINAFKANNNALPQGIQDDLNSPHTGLINNASNDFVRIIGPNSYPPFGEPNEAVSGTNMHYPGLPFTPYNTFLDYFTYLKDTFGPSKTSKKLTTLGNGKIACIKGEYGGSTEGTTPSYQKQSYNLWASIDDNDTLTIKGSGSVIGTIEMYVTKWDLLNPAAAYGGSPSFSLTKGGTKETSKNNIYAWIFGDFFAGLNIGAIGSSVQLNNVAVGDMNSSEWFAKLPSEGLLFNKLWTGGETNYWNQWAKELNDRSDAYNFSYAERFSAPQISLNPAKADTLTVELLSLLVDD